MQDIVLRKIDFLTKDNFTPSYGGAPTRMLWASDEPELFTGLDQYWITPWVSLYRLNITFPLVFTDIYRSPASSAIAYKNKSGVAKPGFSGHNYGISIDIDIEETLKRHPGYKYWDMCFLLEGYGWTNYQGIQHVYKRGKEDWHFNFIGKKYAHNPRDNMNIKNGGSTQVNKWIEDRYQFSSDTKTIQTMLKKLRFYTGDIDGSVGPLTNNAVKSFKKAWLPDKLSALWSNPKVDLITLRILHIVSADVIDKDSGNIIL